MVDKDGGPAFPVLEKVQEYREDRYVDVYMPMRGMSLRDYFAGQAIAGQANYQGFHPNIENDAYAIADAMLEARKK